MKICLRDLAASSDGRLYFDYSIDLREEEVHYDRPFQDAVHITGSVSDNSGAISLRARVETVVSAHCARCNRPFSYDKELDVFFFLAKELQSEDIDDIIVVESDDVELDDIIVPELILSMPMKELCEEDCKGLCHRCGKNLNEGDCGCPAEAQDPRMAKIAEMFNALKTE